MTELERVLQQWLEDIRLPRNERVWALGQALALVPLAEALAYSAALTDLLDDDEAWRRDPVGRRTVAATLRRVAALLEARPPA